jgi:SnoaL-like domain
MRLTVADWLAEYRRAWIERDPDAAAALFTDDAPYRRQPYDQPFIGAPGVRSYWANVTATQRDVELEYGTPVVDGNRAAVEWWVTLVNDGTEVTLAGEFMLRFVVLAVRGLAPAPVPRATAANSALAATYELP